MLEKTLERPWTARRSNHSILKEISSEYSLERLMLKLQYFGHLMRTASVQFGCVSSLAQLCPTLCDPMDYSTPGLPGEANYWSSLKLISIKSVMPSNHLVLCHLLLLLPSIFPSIRVFSNESVLHIRWPKYWSFSFSISLSNEYSGLIPLSDFGRH